MYLLSSNIAVTALAEVLGVNYVWQHLAVVLQANGTFGP